MPRVLADLLRDDEAREREVVGIREGAHVLQRRVAAGRREVLGLEFTAFVLVDMRDAVGAYPELAIADRALGRRGGRECGCGQTHAEEVRRSSEVRSGASLSELGIALQL